MGYFGNAGAGAAARLLSSAGIARHSIELVRRSHGPRPVGAFARGGRFMVELSPLRQLRVGQLPKMVSWYDPRLLARIGVRTIISSVFGQYADQRLIQAVTDSCEDKDLCTRYDYSDLKATDPNRRIAG